MWHGIFARKTEIREEDYAPLKIEKTCIRWATNNNKTQILLDKLKNYEGLTEVEKNLVHRFFAKSNRNVRKYLEEGKKYSFYYNENKGNGDCTLAYKPASKEMWVYRDIKYHNEIVVLKDGIIDEKELIEVMSYSKFLDTITEDNLEKKLVEEIGKFIITVSSNEHKIWGRKSCDTTINQDIQRLNKLNIFNKLKKSYNYLKKEVGEISQQEEEKYDNGSEFFDNILFDLTETEDSGNNRRSEFISEISFDTSEISDSSSIYDRVQQENKVKDGSENIEEEI